MTNIGSWVSENGLKIRERGCQNMIKPLLSKSLKNFYWINTWQAKRGVQ